MALSDIIRTGGGNIQYLFHVCGYPWAVCTSPALRDLLDSGDYNTYRRRIFGHAWYGSPGSEEYFADDTDLCPIFTTLQTPGRQRWRLNESKGRLDGGSWSVEIEDRALGHTWQHGGSQSFWGLEGVHRIAQPFKDDITAYGTLSQKFDEDDSTIEIYEEHSTTLSARITAGISADTYYLCWLGQECVAITAQSASDHELTLTAGERGLFRSVEQHHRIQEYGDANPIITDAPLSIVDKPCWLWMFVLTKDDSEIITTPGIVRWGKVGTRVETKKGITKIDCLSPMSILDNDVKAEQFHGGYMSGFVLSRPTDSDNTDAECLINRQSPHIVLREFTSDSDTTGTARNIWLCAAGSSVTFNTVQELYDKIDDEFGLCLTGDSTLNPGITSLLYRYNIGYTQDGSAPVVIQYVKDGGSDVTKLSLMSGDIPYLLNLGDPYTKYSNTLESFLEGVRRGAQFHSRWTVFDTASYTNGLWLACINGDIDPSDGSDNLGSGEYPGMPQPGKRIFYVSQYLYEWEWSAQEIWDNQGRQPRYDFNMADNKIYFLRDTDISMIEASDIYYLGSPSDKSGRYGRFTVITPYPNETYPYINVGSEIHAAQGFKAPYYVGNGLFYMPALEDDVDDIYDDDNNIIERTDDDPWRISGAKMLRSDNAHDIFSTLFGGSAVDIPESAKLYHMVGFYDVTRNGSYDHYSFIDWDDFDEKIKPINTNHDYRLDIENEVNLYDIFCSELVLHGFSPTLEYVDTYAMYRVLFRRIGPANATEAVNSGRSVTNSDIVYGQSHTDTHVDANMFNKLKIKCNFIDGEAKGKINVSYPTGFQVNSNESKTVTINSPLTHIKKLGARNNIQTIYAYRHFENLMRSFAMPNPQYRVMCTGAMGLEAAVNREFLLTDPTGFKPWTHEQGLNEVVALMTGIDIDLGARKMVSKIQARIDSELLYGYAPACYVETGSSKIGDNTIEASSTLHQFTSSNQMVDCMHFDCYTWNKAVNVYTDRGCDCNDYPVYAIEVGTIDPDLLVFDVTEVSSDGSITLVDVEGGTSYTAWDTAKNYVLIFADYDDCEDCQKKYIFYADHNNTLGADNDTARRYV